MGALYFLILIVGFSFALIFEGRVDEEKELEIRILEKVFQDLTGKKNIKVFVIGPEGQDFAENIKKFSKKLKKVKACGGSDIVYVAGRYTKKLPPECRGMMVFGSRREVLFRYSNAVGSFYWKKGRPNLTLIRERLKRMRIRLSPDYNRFIESLKESHRERFKR